VKRRLFDLPWPVPVLSATLLALGVLFVRSSTANTIAGGADVRQIKVIVASLPVLVLFGGLRHRRLARLAFPLYFLGLASLVAVLFVGVSVGGARRWFDAILDFRVQPSELMKPLLVLALARWLEFRPEPERLRDLVVPLLLTLVPCILIKIEPDLGTALLLLPVPAAMLWVAGARRVHYVGGALLVAVLVPAVCFSPLLHDYQKERVKTFLQSVPELSAQALEARRAGDLELARSLSRELIDHQRGAGYQSHCSQTSIGSGGLTGKGLGQGPQNQLEYLPARHTDFIFAVIAEEWGLVGAGAVVVLFLLLGASFLSVASGTRDRFSQLVSVGAAACIVPQAFANVAMTCGLIPVTGIPLPFISQGGSSVLSSFLLLGIVVAAARSRRDGEPFLYPLRDPVDPFHARAAAVPVRDTAL
jgi:rod shape determining protein RodA